ncbi:ribonuclease SLFN12-like [Acomys russatus]|uniref:ribonuclease SLFN12-like n=1 Tax=Acomys russatus TaxID=60746 RepID=UPI0021E1DBE5|nr:ribonuclease SLFN12-like [Acomys russatus]
MSTSVDQETDYTELVLSVGEITLGEKTRNSMKNYGLKRREVKNISQAVCALLNSGGGVVKAHIKNPTYSFTRDGIGRDLEDSLLGILPLTHKYLDFMQNKDCFLIFVEQRKPNHLGQQIATLKTNFYMRNFSSSLEMKAPAAVQMLKAMKYSAETSESRQSSSEDAICNELLNECSVLFNSARLSFKDTFCFTKSKYAEVKLSPKEKILEVLPKTVSAFANTDGGYLFIGLDGKKQQVIGFEAEEGDLVHLESEIAKCIRQLPVTHFCEEKGTVKYSCKFIEAHKSGAVCSYVCALRVERFCCAVFAAEPESWRVEDSCVRSFTTEEWVKLQMEPTAVVSGMEISSLGALCTEPFSQNEKCERLLLTELGSLPERRLVISKSWPRHLGLQEKPEVIWDVLHISPDGLLTLHIFVQGDEQLEDDSTALEELGAKLKSYCKETALTLRQTLVNLGGYTGKIGIVIKITYLGRKAVPLYDSSSEIHYPTNYYLTSDTITDLKKLLLKFS